MVKSKPAEAKYFLQPRVADVSIIAANYNNAFYLPVFLDSIVNSSVLPLELIIVDDGSTDNSVEIIKSYHNHDFLKLIEFRENQGFTNALNAALEAATSKYIMRADPDDAFVSDRIERQVLFLENNPHIDIIGTNAFYFFDRPELKINRTNFPLTHQKICEAYRKGEHGLLHATVCARRSIYQQYRYQKFAPGEDYEIFSRMVRDGHFFANLKDSCYYVRIHRSSSTSNITYESIERTFRFRDKIFGTRTSNIRIWLYYNYIRNYRDSQLSNSTIKRYYYLILAVLCNPKKLFNRVFL